MDLILQGNGELISSKRVVSRSSSMGCSSRIFYYCRSSEGVPFKWEMQPGTPKDPPKEETLPPLSPPPALLSIGLPKPSINIEEPKPSFKRRLMFWKRNKKNNQEILSKIKANQAARSREISNEKVRGSLNAVHYFFEISSSDDGEFMGSSRSEYSSSSSSSCSLSSPLSFSNGSFAESLSRIQSPVKKDSIEVHGPYTCSPWNFTFTSIIGHVARRV